ncbi:DUF6185 family protein [Streptomyces sp. NPDC088785]|uniref:DUF6185 family protein n=1 Tax=Streptomyces sp. NPDC088785 TaxID=3365897 RepID=UPI00381EC731
MDVTGGRMVRAGARARGWFWSSVVAAAVLLLLGAPPATADGAGPCDPAALRGSPVSSRVELFQHGYADAVVVVETTVKVPRSWRRASGLLFSPRSGRYREAMRCLVADGDGTVPRDKEERDGLPVVVAGAKTITVTDTVRLTVGDESGRLTGPWDITLDGGGYRLLLSPPPALRSATWRVTLVRDGNDLLAARPTPDRLSTDTEYIWSSVRADKGPPPEILLSAPWRARATAHWGEYPQMLFIQGAHTACLLLIPLAYGVCRFLARRRGFVPPHIGVLSAAVTLQAVLGVFNGLDFGLAWALNDRGDFLSDTGWFSYQSWLVIGWAAFGGAVAWLGIAGYPVRRRRLPVGALAAVPVAAALVRADAPGERMSLSVGAGLVWLTCSGVLALALRGWRELRGRPVRRVHLIPPFLLGAAAAALITGMYVKQTLDTRRQLNWLVENTDTSLSFDALNFPSYFFDTIRYMWWLVILLAAVPVLRALPPAARIDTSVRVLVALLGGIALQDWPDSFVGVPSALIPLLTTAVFLGLIRANRRRTLLDWPLTVPGPATALTARTLAEVTAVAGESARADLHAVALRYHALEQEGRKMDAAYRVTADMPASTYTLKRESLEGDLRDLSRWPPPSPTALSLTAGQSGQPAASGGWAMPEGVTPVDVAMSVGPGATPWQNGLQSAALATVLGLPVLVYQLYLNYGGSWWVSQLQGWFGPLWLVYNVLFCVLPWTAGGFLLGFFWRELPGRRGPVKVLPLVAAYTSAMLVDQFLCHAFDQPEPAYRWGMTGLLTITLTVTGILMDGRTLRRQRPSWATFWSPLFSVYRLGAAQTGMAFVVAQTAAIVGLWIQVRTGIEPPASAPSPQVEK